MDSSQCCEKQTLTMTHRQKRWFIKLCASLDWQNTALLGHSLSSKTQNCTPDGWPLEGVVELPGPLQGQEAVVMASGPLSMQLLAMYLDNLCKCGRSWPCPLLLYATSQFGSFGLRILFRLPVKGWENSLESTTRNLDCHDGLNNACQHQNTWTKLKNKI